MPRIVPKPAVSSAPGSRHRANSGQRVNRAPIGPTGWATVANGPRERVNVNSRGCVEVIRGSTRANGRLRGPYEGWCSCRPASLATHGELANDDVVTDVHADKWRWRVSITDQLVRVVRLDDAGVAVTFDFPLASPDYRAPTQAVLEIERKLHC